MQLSEQFALLTTRRNAEGETLVIDNHTLAFVYEHVTTFQRALELYEKVRATNWCGTGNSIDAATANRVPTHMLTRNG